LNDGPVDGMERAMTNRDRTLRAVALLAALALLPALARAQPRRASTAPAASHALLDRWEAGAGLGLAIPFESGIDTGFKLGADAFYGLTSLSPSTILQVGGKFAWTYNSFSSSSGSLNSIDLLPVARLRAAITPQVFGFGDVGLGMAVVRGSVSSANSTDAALLLQLGGGLGYHLNPQLALTFEPAFNIYAKDSSITQFTLMVGFLFRS
jgi:hypothetical protein